MEEQEEEAFPARDAEEWGYIKQAFTELLREFEDRFCLDAYPPDLATLLIEAGRDYLQSKGDGEAYLEVCSQESIKLNLEAHLMQLMLEKQQSQTVH
jgi:hypothetical protein